MQEVGIDLTGNLPQPLDPSTVSIADVVITMGCGDQCPFYPGVTYLDWPLDDPAGKTLEQIRPIRNEIERRTRVLAEQLLNATR